MATTPPRVNNAVYHDLGDRWYEADDDPLALLRAQGRLHAPWISSEVRRVHGDRACRVLDVGCGGGLVANDLAGRGHTVVGVDLAQAALDVATRHDATGRVRYIRADARSLPFPDGSFEAVCAMDFLEHVDALDPVVAEMSRVLVPEGLFFFHTFNRNFFAFLVVIKGVEWFVRNVPRDLHRLHAFIKPAELRASCETHGLLVREILGCEPRPSFAWLRLLATGVVPSDAAFQFTRRTWTGYSGVAEKA